MAWTPSGREPDPVTVWPLYTPREDAPRRLRAAAQRRRHRRWWRAARAILGCLRIRQVATPVHEVRVRRAQAGDALDLLELTLGTAATVTPGPLLVAETGGTVRAALSLTSGARLAEDSLLGERLVALLRSHARQLELEADA